MTQRHREQDRRTGPHTDPALESAKAGGSRPGAADAAGWQIAADATTNGREQLAYLLSQRDVVEKIQQRFGNLEASQRQGHVFEWMHELSYNLDAIARDDTTRLRVTTWLGQPHDPADLRLFGPDGAVLREAQAKVIGDSAARLSRVDGIAAAKYDGMDLLVPSNHAHGTEALLDRRLSMHEGPLHDRYRDVYDRVTDRVSHGVASSEPVSTAELADVTRDPSGHVQSVLSRVSVGQVLSAGGTAATAAGAISAITQLAVAGVRDGNLHGVDWVETARRSAAAAAAAGATALIGQSISLAAQHAIADGATQAVTHAFAETTLPFALARATWSVAGAAHGWATGRLDGQQAAAETAEAVTRTAAVWACGAIGQTVIPVPVVGAMIGGLVGQCGAAFFISGLRIALTARDLGAERDRVYEQLVQETDRVASAARAELVQLTELASQYDCAFSEHVLPLLSDLEASIWTGDPSRVLRDLADLTSLYAGTPMFNTLAEFDVFMADDSNTLLLRLGPARA